MKQFSVEEYSIPFFSEKGYVRKLCPLCNEHYWTLNLDQDSCGESTTQGCATYTFINESPMPKEYTLDEMRECFLSFFERRGHKRISPYPVVSRWRDDLYFTNASIVDFQPHVTNGIAPPPANPLVISQPCIRFVDVDNVGPTFGRHLTIFEMGGHHAFNYPIKEIYWKDETVRLHHDFVTKKLGVHSEEIVYKEGIWSGGGNAGPDFEPIIRGLETSTLVFMKYRVSNGDFVELPIRTIDTGYGIERLTWLSQGSISCFHAIYGQILSQIFEMVNYSIEDEPLLKRIAQSSGLMSSSRLVGRNEGRNRLAKMIEIPKDQLDKIMLPIENSFAVLDHTKCLVFMLSEGVVPSNIKEGYLARLILRRTCRSLEKLQIEDSLFDLINYQIDFWSKEFPHIEEMREGILELLKIERDKYLKSLRRGKILVKRIAGEMRRQKNSQISIDRLIELYDSHGLPPEMVKETAELEDIRVNIPENFFAMVAEKHQKTSNFKKKETFNELEDKILVLPETRKLYYEDSYIREFKTKITKVLNGKYVTLKETAFYPESGGQPADHGYLEIDSEKFRVVDVQKIGEVIIHIVDNPISEKSSAVTGSIEWDRRNNLMKSHTATHILMGAARRVLGEHVWQAGAQKGVEKSRLDISHFKRLTIEEIQELEFLSNKMVLLNKPIEVLWLPREEAEKRYGFRLYQGGAVLGRDVRVVKTEDWEIEACGGTHLNSTGEVGLIKILNTERIQDGVERIVFSTGLSALKAVQNRENTLLNTSKLLEVSPEQVKNTTDRLLIELKKAKKEKEKLMRKIAEFTAKDLITGYSEVSGTKLIVKTFKEEDTDQLVKIADVIVTSDPLTVVCLFLIKKTVQVVVMVGREATEFKIRANQIASAIGSVLGGGGSGDSTFAQGGGPLKHNLSKAIQKVEEMIIKQRGEDDGIS